MKCDFKIENGCIFNSVSENFCQGDIWVNDGKIIDSDPNNVAAVVIDASGKYVVPGLIDEHAHFYLHGSLIGSNPDTVCIPNGITTAVDAGTTGVSGFESFYNQNIVSCEPTILAYLSVSTYGNKSLCLHEENHDPADFREDLILKMFEKYPHVLRGLKVRMSKSTLGDYGLSPLKKAVEIADTVNKAGYKCIIAAHYDNLPDDVSVCDMMALFRPGDIVAHVFQTKGETIFNSDGSVKECVKNAQHRGVYIDDCHGRVHWSFANLEKALNDGFYPDIISSDIVRVSEYVRPGFSLNYAMSALSAAGMEVEKILKSVTYTPAKALGIADYAGVLEVGRAADIAILDIVDSDMMLFDNYGGQKKADKLFIPLLTMKRGRIAYRQIFF